MWIPLLSLTDVLDEALRPFNALYTDLFLLVAFQMRQKRREKQPFENDFFPSLFFFTRWAIQFTAIIFTNCILAWVSFCIMRFSNFSWKITFYFVTKLHTFIALLPFWRKHAIIFDRFLVETWNFLDYVFDVASSKSNLEVLWRPFKTPSCLDPMLFMFHYESICLQNICHERGWPSKAQKFAEIRDPKIDLRCFSPVILAVA